jgi:histidinol-phosphatase (PHP family)
MRNPLPDYHIHTHLCKHATGAMEEYVEHAIGAGIVEMGFADHMPVMPEPQFCMSDADLPVYVSRVLELRERYRDRITIRLGCEMDIVPGRIDDIEHIIAAYPFDYVIGSIHYLNDWPFDQRQYRGVFEDGDVDAIYRRYFESLIEGAGLGFFDIIGHIDIIKCLGYFPTDDVPAIFGDVAAALASHGLAVELNMSGLDKPCAEQYPSAILLAILAEHGIPVTVGSDAHAPDQVARHYDLARDLLIAAGYDSVLTFDRRTPTPMPLAQS